MADIEQLIEGLKDIRTYLIKLGPARRKTQNLEVKIKDVEQNYLKFNELIKNYSDLIKSGTIDEKVVKNINKVSAIYIDLYDNIKNLFTEKNQEDMETFNIKTALGLIPVMTEDEKAIQQLIDNIEYYSSMLTKPECISKLIKFILKSRLTQSAKLKLNNDYPTIDALLNDMKSNLLAKKSANAVQTKLHNARQNSVSISEFGQELSELFVKLTIAQANGNSDDYKTLRAINEKMAIKKFADGLRNRRISTIIAARNFDSLKDAIQAAVDEETTAPGAPEGVSLFYRNNTYRGNYRHAVGNSQPRGNFRGNYYKTFNTTTNRNNGNNMRYNQKFQRGYNASKSFRGRNTSSGYNRGINRGINRYQNNRSNHQNTYKNTGNINMLSSTSGNINSEENLQLDEFFRE